MTSSRVENSSSRAARKVKLALMGPAFVAAIGYIDPGNFATNIQAGASFWLSAAVGRGMGQPDGDADPGALCQTGHCHRQKSGRADP